MCKCSHTSSQCHTDIQVTSHLVSQTTCIPETHTGIEPQNLL
uniref:Uncharacterized protein n=1 Tax=Anguilla anguilla TaxID=7936 RepID=A0A0E9U6N1_ANGAN